MLGHHNRRLRLLQMLDSVHAVAQSAAHAQPPNIKSRPLRQHSVTTVPAHREHQQRRKQSKKDAGASEAKQERQCPNPEQWGVVFQGDLPIPPDYEKNTHRCTVETGQVPGAPSDTVRSNSQLLNNARFCKIHPGESKAMHCGVSIQVEDVYKAFDQGIVKALRGVSLNVAAGEIIALQGSSGSGKSTLLSLIGLLDQPTRGRILVDGNDLARIRSRHQFRARRVGFVFQFHHLISTMTLLENVMSPLMVSAMSKRSRHERALMLMKMMDIEHRRDYFPGTVSGGERQRAAIARALAASPPLILADEPTGNLDSANARQAMDLFIRHARDFNATVLIATHNPMVVAHAHRAIVLQDGKVIESDFANPAEPGTT